MKHEANITGKLIHQFIICSACAYSNHLLKSTKWIQKQCILTFNLHNQILIWTFGFALSVHLQMDGLTRAEPERTNILKANIWNYLEIGHQEKNRPIYDNFKR